MAGRSSSAEELLHQRLLVVRVVDDEPTVDPDRLAVAAEQAGADRVEGPGLDLAALLAGQRDDPLAELFRRPVGERHGEDPPRSHVLDADEVGDPMCQDPGLAAPGAGEDEDRTVGGGDRARLFRIEARDDLFRTERNGLAMRRGGGLDRGRVERRRRVLRTFRRLPQPLRLVGRERRRR